ncbi:hypothetical protein D920_00028 [Enterococcus faecalis 13-SD-W-01]|nr:hypothetical protein D920_00028 [Enterococcus faecalis 13-SD-W-01]
MHYTPKPLAGGLAVFFYLSIRINEEAYCLSWQHCNHGRYSVRLLLP